MKTPWWFLSKGLVPWILWPVSVVYYWAHRIVYFVRGFNQKKSDIPVVCIGGILAGGVGKTPIVRAVATRLGAPVMMRGYRRAVSDDPYQKSFQVLENTAVELAGDEAKMLANGGLVVYVGDRGQSVAKINRRNHSARAIVMDDGFQNPKIRKDISVLIFDGKIGVGNGFLLPAGPLRETVQSGMSCADAVIITGSRPSNPDINAYTWLGGVKKPVFFAKTANLAGNIKGRVIAFAGIGFPQKFFDAVGGMDRIKLVEAVSFPDHHNYTTGDIKRLFRLSRKYNAHLVTTEKDWVKIPAYLRRKIRYMPMTVEIEDGFWTWLDKKLGRVNKDRK